MSKIASINFKKSVDFQVFHNSTVRPNYAIGGELIANRKGYEALKLKEQIIENAKEAYIKNTKQKFQAKSYEWSAVVNIKSDTNMQDLERLAEHFETKYGFQCYQIAIHRDEGHINDDGEKVINHHAHLEFITLDKETGKNCFKLRDFPKSKMREIQTEVAEILNMERGQDKRISKRERIEPRRYAQIKEAERKEQAKLKAEHKQELEAKDQTIQEIINTTKETTNNADEYIQELEAELEQEKLNSKEIKAYIEQFRKNCAGKGLPKEFFRDISNLKQQAEPTTKELLNNTLETLLQSYLREKERNIELENENEALKAENTELKAKNKHILTQEQIQEIINQALAQKKAEIEQKNKEIQDLKAENHTIKEQNYRYFAENDKLESLCNFLRQENDKLLKEVNNDYDDYDDYDDYEHSEQDQEHNKPKIHKRR